MSWWNPISWFRNVGDATPAKPPRRQLVAPVAMPFGVLAQDLPIHYGRKLDVPTIFNAHDTAEAGYPRRFQEIGRDRLKADGHLRSAVGQRRDGVGRKPWVILPGGDSEVDKAAAAELERNLRRARGFRSALKHHAMTFWHGYALSEIDWRYRDGIFVPAAFRSPEHHHIIFDANDEPRYAPPWRGQPGTRGPDLNGEELRAGAWWYSRIDGERAAVAGLAITGIIWSHLKTLSMRDWVRLAHRFGIPFVYGVYEQGQEDDPNASEKDKAKLKEAVQKLGTDGWAVFSKAAEIKVTEIKGAGGGAGEIHKALIQCCDQVISKLIVGATTLQQTSGPTGSYAQSKVHADRGFEILDGDANDLGDSFESYVGEQFVTYNQHRFPGAEPPRLKLHLVKDQSPTARVGVFAKAAEMGVPVSISQVRTELQLKPPTGPDDIAKPSDLAQPANDEVEYEPPAKV